MGRLVMRVASAHLDFEIVHINELNGDAATAAHLLEFDSVHGRWDGVGKAGSNYLTVNGKRLRYSRDAGPELVDWDDVDIVLECTGAFRSMADLQPYLEQVQKVIVAAPVNDGALNLVMGINDDSYQPDRDHIITAASCTTNCLAPVVKVMLEQFGIVHGAITTIHDATNTQVVVDHMHKDLRRARAANMSLIPTSTGSATAITMIFPELAGRLNGLAVRVPMLNGSLTDCVFVVKQPTTVEAVNAALREAAEGPLAGILGFESRPLVSIDYVNDPRSGIVDGPSTQVIDGSLVKLLVWYDNEMGYVNRMIELTAKVAALL
ncbi:MAG: glyceraldehyde 3-phosphate dehydrogenase [Rhodothermales bacterium]|jgi:glyceraldehyde 3-phosphate dehydrogenase